MNLQRKQTEAKLGRCEYSQQTALGRGGAIVCVGLGGCRRLVGDPREHIKLNGHHLLGAVHTHKALVAAGRHQHACVAWGVLRRKKERK